MSHIEFFVKATGEAAPTHDYFVMEDKVWRDSYETCESQSAVVGFYDFIVECPEIGWRVTGWTEA